jgi:hypothetical protein
LTYEHVPPASAYNSYPAEMYLYDDWLERVKTGRGRFEIQQRGTGYYALCVECNSTRGGTWYVPEFERWVGVGAELLRGVPDDAPNNGGVVATAQLQHLRPALFAKQVVMMPLTINEPALGVEYPELREFVLHRNARGLPTRHRLFLSLFRGDVARWAGLYVAMQVDSFGQPKLPPILATDLLYPPFAYTLTIDEADTLPREGEITHFTSFGPDDEPELELTIGLNEVLLPPEGDPRDT